MSLPIDPILPQLIATLKTRRRAVLEAPPGAGKTTRVPLALLDAGLCRGRIVMLEPRRLAARAAADRMAKTLGESVGQTVGYRMRGDSKTSKATKIEVVTEGVLTRMLQADPDLPGIGALIFDEFHERSLQADLGLALSAEVADVLREDLILLPMSATLDAAPIANLINAPVLRAEGRSFEVDIRWLDRPLKNRTRLDGPLADLVLKAEEETRETGGGILVFLPGEGEIRRVETLLKAKLPANCTLRPLYGALPQTAQRAAIAPQKTGRKIVLSTNIAETSLTIEDIRVVVDMGLSRRARFDPGSGMSRLVTERVTRAEATQRTGRAGRVADGTCYRLWTRGEEGAMAAYPPAEIEAADLTSLALELAQWGAAPADLRFLSPPPDAAFGEARALLTLLGALDADGRITDHGRHLARLPLHPRLGHMLLTAGKPAAPLAALLSERDPMRGATVDVNRRLDALRGRHGAQANRKDLDRIRDEAKRLSRLAPSATDLGPGQMAALAYPDRIGQRRSGDAPRYILSGGKGALMPEDDPLAQAPYIVALDTDGDPREARIRLASPLTLSELRDLVADRITFAETCTWSRRHNRVEARRQDRFGALVLEDRNWRDVPEEEIARAMLDGVRLLGLRLTGAAARLQRRVEMVRASGHPSDLPDFSDAALLADAEAWLLPYLGRLRNAADWRGFDPLPALQARLDWTAQTLLDKAAPARYVTPLGRTVAIDYGENGPEIALRLQEMFGVGKHPTAGGVPLSVTLLSPAGRPVQVTRDLPGFWRGSYADVRKDMRARYPKHPWPEDPASASPTLKAKRRPGGQD
jgi:ATP-dependent helicase HrpB